MKNYIEAEFSCNEYYLLANLLKDSYKIGDILKNGRPDLDSIQGEERATLLERFEQFMSIASNMPAIQSLLNYGPNFDKLPSSEYEKYNKYMNDRINKIAEVENDEQFIQLEGEDVLQAFNQLRETPFYDSILKHTLEHKKALESSFARYRNVAEETLRPIIEGEEKKKANILVLPPELYSGPKSLGTYGDTIKSVASYPKSFDIAYPNLKVTAMMHEIMHEYIPLASREQFTNKTQYMVYSNINHSLVELATNCELGTKICGVESYFLLGMHQEVIEKRWIGKEAKDADRINKDFFIKQGISFPPEFEFESMTQYHPSEFRRTTKTEKDELSIDKIRGIVYPYFLLFKNRQAKEPMQQTIAEIERDSKTIKRIYGEDFYEWISNPEYLAKIQEKIKDVNSIVDLNDSIAKEAFGIEKVRTAEKPQQIEIADIGRTVFTGKTSVQETKKMEAQAVVGQDIIQMTQEKTAEEQEN